MDVPWLVYPPVYANAFHINIKAFLKAHGHKVKLLGLRRATAYIVELQSSQGATRLHVYEEQLDEKDGLVCDQCRVMGWQHHPVCNSKYHFIIPSEATLEDTSQLTAVVEGRYTGKLPLLYKWAAPNDLADEDAGPYNAAASIFESQDHLLHGMLHLNGFGHLLRMNGSQGGSRRLIGKQLLTIWDRLCTLLRAREVSVEDVSNKAGMLLRMLHTAAYGTTWYGKIGYGFGRGSFNISAQQYAAAVTRVRTAHLSDIAADFRHLPAEPMVAMLQHYTSRGAPISQLCELLARLLAFTSQPRLYDALYPPPPGWAEPPPYQQQQVLLAGLVKQQPAEAAAHGAVAASAAAGEGSGVARPRPGSSRGNKRLHSLASPLGLPDIKTEPKSPVITPRRRLLPAAQRLHAATSMPAAATAGEAAGEAAGRSPSLAADVPMLQAQAPETAEGAVIGNIAAAAGLSKASGGSGRLTRLRQTGAGRAPVQRLPSVRHSARLAAVAAADAESPLVKHNTAFECYPAYKACKAAAAQPAAAAGIEVACDACVPAITATNVAWHVMQPLEVPAQPVQITINTLAEAATAPPAWQVDSAAPNASAGGANAGLVQQEQVVQCVAAGLPTSAPAIEPAATPEHTAAAPPVAASANNAIDQAQHAAGWNRTACLLHISSDEVDGAAAVTAAAGSDSISIEPPPAKRCRITVRPARHLLQPDGDSVTGAIAEQAGIENGPVAPVPTTAGARKKLSVDRSSCSPAGTDDSRNSSGNCPVRRKRSLRGLPRYALQNNQQQGLGSQQRSAEQQGLQQEEQQQCLRAALQNHYQSAGQCSQPQQLQEQQQQEWLGQQLQAQDQLQIGMHHHQQQATLQSTEQTVQKPSQQQLQAWNVEQPLLQQQQQQPAWQLPEPPGQQMAEQQQQPCALPTASQQNLSPTAHHAVQDQASSYAAWFASQLQGRLTSPTGSAAAVAVVVASLHDQPEGGVDNDSNAAPAAAGTGSTSPANASMGMGIANEHAQGAAAAAQGKASSSEGQAVALLADADTNFATVAPGTATGTIEQSAVDMETADELEATDARAGQEAPGDSGLAVIAAAAADPDASAEAVSGNEGHDAAPPPATAATAPMPAGYYQLPQQAIDGGASATPAAGPRSDQPAEPACVGCAMDASSDAAGAGAPAPTGPLDSVATEEANMWQAAPEQLAGVEQHEQQRQQWQKSQAQHDQSWLPQHEVGQQQQQEQQQQQQVRMNTMQCGQASRQQGQTEATSLKDKLDTVVQNLLEVYLAPDKASEETGAAGASGEADVAAVPAATDTCTPAAEPAGCWGADHTSAAVQRMSKEAAVLAASNERTPQSVEKEDHISSFSSAAAAAGVTVVAGEHVVTRQHATTNELASSTALEDAGCGAGETHQAAASDGAAAINPIVAEFLPNVGDMVPPLPAASAFAAGAAAAGSCVAAAAAPESNQAPEPESAAPDSTSAAAPAPVPASKFAADDGAAAAAAPTPAPEPAAGGKVAPAAVQQAACDTTGDVQQAMATGPSEGIADQDAAPAAIFVPDSGGADATGGTEVTAAVYGEGTPGVPAAAAADGSIGTTTAAAEEDGSERQAAAALAASAAGPANGAAATANGAEGTDAANVGMAVAIADNDVDNTTKPPTTRRHGINRARHNRPCTEAAAIAAAKAAGILVKVWDSKRSSRNNKGQVGDQPSAHEHQHVTAMKPGQDACQESQQSKPVMLQLAVLEPQQPSWQQAPYQEDAAASHQQQEQAEQVQLAEQQGQQHPQQQHTEQRKEQQELPDSPQQQLAAWKSARQQITRQAAGKRNQAARTAAKAPAGTVAEQRNEQLQIVEPTQQQQQGLQQAGQTEVLQHPQQVVMPLLGEHGASEQKQLQHHQQQHRHELQDQVQEERQHTAQQEPAKKAVAKHRQGKQRSAAKYGIAADSAANAPAVCAAGQQRQDGQEHEQQLGKQPAQQQQGVLQQVQSSAPNGVSAVVGQVSPSAEPGKLAVANVQAAAPVATADGHATAAPAATAYGTEAGTPARPAATAAEPDVSSARPTSAGVASDTSQSRKRQAAKVKDWSYMLFVPRRATRGQQSSGSAADTVQQPQQPQQQHAQQEQTELYNKRRWKLGKKQQAIVDSELPAGSGFGVGEYAEQQQHDQAAHHVHPIKGKKGQQKPSTKQQAGQKADAAVGGAAGDDDADDAEQKQQEQERQQQADEKQEGPSAKIQKTQGGNRQPKQGKKQQAAPGSDAAADPPAPSIKKGISRASAKGQKGQKGKQVQLTIRAEQTAATAAAGDNTAAAAQQPIAGDAVDGAPAAGEDEVAAAPAATAAGAESGKRAARSKQKLPSKQGGKAAAASLANAGDFQKLVQEQALQAQAAQEEQQQPEQEAVLQQPKQLVKQPVEPQVQQQPEHQPISHPVQGHGSDTEQARGTAQAAVEGSEPVHHHHQQQEQQLQQAKQVQSSQQSVEEQQGQESLLASPAHAGRATRRQLEHQQWQRQPMQQPFSNVAGSPVQQAKQLVAAAFSPITSNAAFAPAEAATGGEPSLVPVWHCTRQAAKLRRSQSGEEQQHQQPSRQSSIAAAKSVTNGIADDEQPSRQEMSLLAAEAAIEQAAVANGNAADDVRAAEQQAQAVGTAAVEAVADGSAAAVNRPQPQQEQQQHMNGQDAAGALEVDAGATTDAGVATDADPATSSAPPATKKPAKQKRRKATFSVPKPKKKWVWKVKPAYIKGQEAARRVAKAAKAAATAAKAAEHGDSAAAAKAAADAAHVIKAATVAESFLLAAARSPAGGDAGVAAKGTAAAKAAAVAKAAALAAAETGGVDPMAAAKAAQTAEQAAAAADAAADAAIAVEFPANNGVTAGKPTASTQADATTATGSAMSGQPAAAPADQAGTGAEGAAAAGSKAKTAGKPVGKLKIKLGQKAMPTAASKKAAAAKAAHASSSIKPITAEEAQPKESAGAAGADGHAAAYALAGCQSQVVPETGSEQSRWHNHPADGMLLPAVVAADAAGVAGSRSRLQRPSKGVRAVNQLFAHAVTFTAAPNADVQHDQSGHAGSGGGCSSSAVANATLGVSFHGRKRKPTAIVLEAVEGALEGGHNPSSTRRKRLRLSTYGRSPTANLVQLSVGIDGNNSNAVSGLQSAVLGGSGGAGANLEQADVAAASPATGPLGAGQEDGRLIEQEQPQQQEQPEQLTYLRHRHKAKWQYQLQQQQQQQRRPKESGRGRPGGANSSNRFPSYLRHAVCTTVSDGDHKPGAIAADAAAIAKTQRRERSSRQHRPPSQQHDEWQLQHSDSECRSKQLRMCKIENAAVPPEPHHPELKAGLLPRTVAGIRTVDQVLVDLQYLYNSVLRLYKPQDVAESAEATATAASAGAHEPLPIQEGAGEVAVAKQQQDSQPQQVLLPFPASDFANIAAQQHVRHTADLAAISSGPGSASVSMPDATAVLQLDAAASDVAEAAAVGLAKLGTAPQAGDAVADTAAQALAPAAAGDHTAVAAASASDSAVVGPHSGCSSSKVTPLNKQQLQLPNFFEVVQCVRDIKHFVKDYKGEQLPAGYDPSKGPTGIQQQQQQGRSCTNEGQSQPADGTLNRQQITEQQQHQESLLAQQQATHPHQQQQQNAQKAWLWQQHQQQEPEHIRTADVKSSSPPDAVIDALAAMTAVAAAPASIPLAIDTMPGVRPLHMHQATVSLQWPCIDNTASDAGRALQQQQVGGHNEALSPAHADLQPKAALSATMPGNFVPLLGLLQPQQEQQQQQAPAGVVSDAMVVDVVSADAIIAVTQQLQQQKHHHQQQQQQPSGDMPADHAFADGRVHITANTAAADALALDADMDEDQMVPQAQQEQLEKQQPNQQSGQLHRPEQQQDEQQEQPVKPVQLLQQQLEPQQQQQVELQLQQQQQTQSTARAGQGQLGCISVPKQEADQLVGGMGGAQATAQHPAPEAACAVGAMDTEHEQQQQPLDGVRLDEPDGAAAAAVDSSMPSTCADLHTQQEVQMPAGMQLAVLNDTSQPIQLAAQAQQQQLQQGEPADISTQPQQIPAGLNAAGPAISTPASGASGVSQQDEDQLHAGAPTAPADAAMVLSAAADEVQSGQLAANVSAAPFAANAQVVRLLVQLDLTASHLSDVCTVKLPGNRPHSKPCKSHTTPPEIICLTSPCSLGDIKGAVTKAFAEVYRLAVGWRCEQLVGLPQDALVPAETATAAKMTSKPAAGGGAAAHTPTAAAGVANSADTDAGKQGGDSIAAALHGSGSAGMTTPAATADGTVDDGSLLLVMADQLPPALVLTAIGSGLDSHPRFRHAGGVEDWAVQCCCGTLDDDGERMIVCDGCGYWMHTRCNGVHDDDDEPPGFMCAACRGPAAAEALPTYGDGSSRKGVGSKRAR